MFNYQKETVLNSLDKAALVAAHDGIDAKVRFHDGGEYFAKYIVDKKIYKTAPVVGEKFKLTLKVADTMLDQHIQILIELGLDNDYRGDYGSALYYFRKPILIDVVLPKTKAEAAKVIYSAIKKAIPAEYRFVDIAEPDTATSNIVITGEDSYQKVRKLTVNVFTCDARCDGNSEEPVALAELTTSDLINGGDFADYIPNNVEFGTYNYVIHNLRLPTNANLRFVSPNAGEMPTQGTTYYQYSFAYCVPRGVHFGGMSVVGQTNQSTTLHTFFVASSLVTEFEKLFTNLGITDFVELGRTGTHTITVLADSQVSSNDLQVEAPKVAAKSKTIVKA